MLQHRTRFFTLVFLLLIALPSYAQQHCTITGRVTDALTGKPLEGASVNFDFTKIKIATDAEGRFSYKVTCQEHDVKVNYVGYILSGKCVLYFGFGH
jgi:protocatechuate 3,4-dioxygenase beta subunit